MSGHTVRRSCQRERSRAVHGAYLVATVRVPSSFGRQRVNIQDVIRPGTRPHESGDDGIAVRGMIVVLAAGQRSPSVGLHTPVSSFRLRSRALRRILTIVAVGLAAGVEQRRGSPLGAGSEALLLARGIVLDDADSGRAPAQPLFLSVVVSRSG